MSLSLDDDRRVDFLERIDDLVVLADEDFQTALRAAAEGRAGVEPRRVDEDTWLRAVDIAGAANDPGARGLIAQYSEAAEPTAFRGELFAVGSDPQLDARTGRVQFSDYRIVAVALEGRARWVGGSAVLAIDGATAGQRGRCCGRDTICQEDLTIIPPTVGSGPSPTPTGGGGPDNVPRPRPLGPHVLSGWGLRGVSAVTPEPADARRLAGLPEISLVTYMPPEPSPDPAPGTGGGIPGGFIQLCTRVTDPFCTAVTPVCEPGDVGFTAGADGVGDTGSGSTPCSPASGGLIVGRDVPALCQHIMSADHLPAACGGWCESCGVPWGVRTGLPPMCFAAQALPGSACDPPRPGAELLRREQLRLQAGWQPGRPATTCTSTGRNGNQACVVCDADGNCRETVVTPQVDPQLAGDPDTQSSSTTGANQTVDFGPEWVNARPPSKPETAPPQAAPPPARTTPGATPPPPTTGPITSTGTDGGEKPAGTGTQPGIGPRQWDLMSVLAGPPIAVPRLAGDPVQLGDGSLRLEHTDLDFDGPARHLRFVRSYNSTSRQRSLLGSNWFHVWDARVRPLDARTAPPFLSAWSAGLPDRPTAVMLLEGDGNAQLFHLDAATQAFLPQAGSTDTLAPVSGGGWAVRSADGRVRRFNADGYLVEDRDRCGVGFSIEYEPTPLYDLYRHFCDPAVLAERGETPDPRRGRLLSYLVGKAGRPDPAREEWVVTAADFRLIRTLEPQLRERLAYARAYLLHLIGGRSGGRLPESVDGGHGWRAIAVTDDLGRALELSYHEAPPTAAGDSWDFSAHPEAGLLAEVRGPAGTRVRFAYDRPNSYPAELNETFLVGVDRHDAPGVAVDVVPALDRVLRFRYQWPTTGAPAGPPSYDQWEGAVQTAYRRFYGTFTGCWYRDVDACLSGATHLGERRLAPGNPDELAREAVNAYVSDVADNLIEVENTGEIETETRFGADPWQADFDRVVAQRYGSSSSAQPATLPGADDPARAWRTSLPRLEITFAASGPLAAGGDRTDAFLPAVLRARYPLETEPTAATPSPGAAPVQPAAGAGACDFARMETERARLPGYAATRAYFDVADPERHPDFSRRLRRTRLTPDQLIAAQVGDPASNDLVSGAQGGGASSGPLPIRRLLGRRAQLAANANRLCAWARLADRDGVVTYFGLNYRGQVLVEAVQTSAGAITVTERLVNADGAPVQERRPVAADAAWASPAAFTAYAYDEIVPTDDAGWDEWLPAFWSRRGNVLRTEQRVALVTDEDEATGAFAPSVGRFARHEYDPLFNQLVRTITGSLQQRAGAVVEVAHSRTDVLLDYQELSLSAPAASARSIVPLLRSLEPWGFHWLRTAQGELDLALIAAWQLPIPLLDEDLNGDGARGAAWASTPARRGVGLPVSVLSGPPTGAELITRTMQWAPHGLPARIDGPAGEVEVFQYYAAGAAPGPFGGATAPTDAAVSAGHRGPLARHVVRRWRTSYPAADGPPTAPNDALAGPYQWLVPAGVPAADVPAALSQLGLPPAMVDDALSTSDLTAGAAGSSLVTSFAYAVTGALRRIFAPTGETRISSDADGRPVTITDQAGTRTESTFNALGLLTSMLRYARDGTIVGEQRFTYDAAGNRLSSCLSLQEGGCAAGSAASARQRFSYTPGEQLREHVDPEGLVSTYRYDERKHLTGSTLTPSTATAPERGTALDRDPEGRVVGVRHGALRDGDAGLLTETFRYDALGRLAGWTDTRRTSWQQAWSSRDLPTRWRQGALAYPAPLTPPSPLEVVRSYDGHRRLIRERRNGIVVNEQRLDPSGRIVARTAAGGGTEYVAYSAAGQPVWRSLPDGTQLVRTEREAPHRRGVCTIRRDPDGSPVADALVADLDVFGRPETKTRVAGDVTLTSTWRYDTEGRFIAAADPYGHTTTYERNWAGWPERIVEPRGDSPGDDVTTVTYDRTGRPRVVTDPAGSVSTVDYDAFGSVSAILLAGQPQAVATFGYDALGRRDTRTVGADAVRTEYDARGDARRELINVGGAEEPLITRDFDTLGRVVRETHLNPGLRWLAPRDRAVTCATTYDALGWVATEALTAGAGAPSTRTDTWTASAGAWQRSCTLAAAGATRTWTDDFDGAGRLLSHTRLGPPGPDFSAQFRWTGERYVGRTQTQAARPSRFSEDLALDPFGLPRAIRYRAVEVDGAGDPLDAGEGVDYCAGPWDFAACGAPLLAIDLARDEIGRIGIAERRIGQPPIVGGSRSADPRPVRWRGYGYSPRRHLAEISEASALAPPDLPEPYGATRGEVEARAAGAATWAYDREPAVGDLRSIALTGGTRRRWAIASPRNPGHELVRVEVDGTTFRVLHDAAGRVERQGTRSFAYHPAGALATVRDGGDLVEAFAYAADGRLVAVWTAEQLAPETVFAYDSSQQVAATSPASGLLWEATWGPGLDRLLEWTNQAAGGDPEIPLLDERGSVIGAWSPSTARLLGFIDEDPEGRRTVFAQDGQSLCEEVGTGDVCAAPGGVPFGFTGGWRSPRTGLAWRRARWYSPQLGQWLTRDPRGAADSHNAYAYVGFDPVNLIDPTGRSSSGPAAPSAPAGRGGAAPAGGVGGPAPVVLASNLGIDPVPGLPWPRGVPPGPPRVPRLPFEELGRGTGREVLEEALRGIRRRPSAWRSLLRDVHGLLRWLAENPELTFAAAMLYSTAAGDPHADQDINRYHLRNKIARRIREPLRNWVPIVEPPAHPAPRGDPGTAPPVTAPPTAPTSPWVDPVQPGTTERQLGPLDPERHHIFPQTFEWYFVKKGIDIDKYTLELGEAWHKAVHRAGFNIDWQTVILFDELAGGVLRTSDIFQIGVEMADRYGIIGAVVPYNGGVSQQTDIPGYLGAPRP